MMAAYVLHRLLLAAASAAIASSSCAYPYALDAPDQERYGDDYNGVALAAGSSITACVDLCCGDPLCVSFSFNDPQPAPSFTCVTGGVCCMLKSGVPPLRNNTYPPGSVRTGVIVNKTSQLPPGPTPPFPPSTFILNATLNATVSYWSGSGDTWPTTWAQDGSVYGWPCDANGSPMGLWRIEGDPWAGQALNPVQVANAPINYTQLCAAYGRTGSYPYINVKPGTTMALNGSIFVTVSCMNYGDDPVFNRQHNLAGFIAESTDGGVTFTNVTSVGAFPGVFAAPMFVSCGQNNDPCRAANGGLMYVFFQGAFDDAAYWDNNDAMWLARVQEGQLANVSAYEYFVGFDPSNATQPVFVGDALQAQPVITFGHMLGENGVMYHPGINRYLMANFGFIDDQGTPRPWHSQPFMSPHRTQLTMLEAPFPWGPWSIFFRDDNSASAPGLYTPTFPSAYVQPVNGNRADLIMFFACLDGAANCRYTLNWQQLTLTLATS